MRDDAAKLRGRAAVVAVSAVVVSVERWLADTWKLIREVDDTVSGEIGGDRLDYSPDPE